MLKNVLLKDISINSSNKSAKHHETEVKILFFV